MKWILENLRETVKRILEISKFASATHLNEHVVVVIKNRSRWLLKSGQSDRKFVSKHGNEEKRFSRVD